ncbi:uncharacterized protein LOC108021988 [Drosophila biarmipes]|uniref:uncharacterized protein LOC108021988 n=1 Tax=Drosophila biarmipes TaxID=125945 RepID=UPI0007E6CD9A|nr:uncharacterized protein LOC108021988 [Drosophila biarmipes]
MKISLAVIGLFLAFFCSSQVITSAFFFERPSTIFCTFFPDFILCPSKDKGSDGSGSGGSGGSSGGNGTAAPGNGTAGNSTNL